MRSFQDRLVKMIHNTVIQARIQSIWKQSLSDIPKAQKQHSSHFFQNRTVEVFVKRKRRWWQI